MSGITLGLYGGTFSPPHLGHKRIAEAFIKQCSLDELLIMPAAIPPHKSVNPDDAPEKRFEMAKLAFSGIEKATVSRLELDREGKSYTILTLNELFKRYGLERGRDRIRLLVGTDMFLTLDKWNRFREIFELAHVVYAGRGDSSEDGKLKEKALYYKENYGAVTEELVLSPLFVSSSMVREMISEKNDPRDYIEESVYEYIKKEKLYGYGKFTEDDLLSLREKVSERLSEKRFRHTLAVEEEAAFIAERLIPEKKSEVRAAALLHDVAKELSSEKQLNYYYDFDIIKINADRTPEAILHALAAPAVIKREFSGFATDDILSAVAKHTTGKVGMSVFDAIIFISDYIELTRKHETCRKCREYFHERIDFCKNREQMLALLKETVKISLSDTLSHIRTKGYELDPDTLLTYEWLRDGGSFDE